MEVDLTGKIVWEWWFFDHVIQDFDANKSNYVGSGKTAWISTMRPSCQVGVLVAGGHLYWNFV